MRKYSARTADDSELYQLNHRELTPVKGTEDTYQVSASLAELVSKGLDYSVLSEGAFDIAIEPLTSLWNFTAKNPKVPKDSLIQQQHCPNAIITISLLIQIKMRLH